MTSLAAEGVGGGPRERRGAGGNGSGDNDIGKERENFMQSPNKTRRLNLEFGKSPHASLEERQRAHSMLQTATRGDQVLAEVVTVGSDGKLQVMASIEGVELTGELEEVSTSAGKNETWAPQTTVLGPVGL